MLWEQRRNIAKLVSVVQKRVTSLVIGIVLPREGSAQNVKNVAISLAVARMDLSSILPRQTLRNSLLFIALVLDSCFVEREEKPPLSMRLHSQVKMIHLLLLLKNRHVPYQMPVNQLVL